MSAKRGPRWPGDPSGGDATFGPLVGLPGEVHFFVKDRQRQRDAETRRLIAGPSSGRQAVPDRLAGLVRHVCRSLRVSLAIKESRRDQP